MFFRFSCNRTSKEAADGSNRGSFKRLWALQGSPCGGLLTSFDAEVGLGSNSQSDVFFCQGTCCSRLKLRRRSIMAAFMSKAFSSQLGRVSTGRCGLGFVCGRGEQPCRLAFM